MFCFKNTSKEAKIPPAGCVPNEFQVVVKKLELTARSSCPGCQKIILLTYCRLSCQKTNYLLQAQLSKELTVQQKKIPVHTKVQLSKKLTVQKHSTVVKLSAAVLRYYRINTWLSLQSVICLFIISYF